jgi:hypothetical protein
MIYCTVCRLHVSSNGTASVTQSDKMGVYHLYGYSQGVYYTVATVDKFCFFFTLSQKELAKPIPYPRYII